MQFISVLFICGLIAFSTYHIVGIIKTIKEKKAKSKIKGENSENEHFN